MTSGRFALPLMVCLLAGAAPAAAQRVRVEATGPNVTVISDAGAGRAREIAADGAGDEVALQAALEQAVVQRGVSWWAPYRLATVLIVHGRGR